MLQCPPWSGRPPPHRVPESARPPARACCALSRAPIFHACVFLFVEPGAAREHAAAPRMCASTRAPRGPARAPSTPSPCRRRAHARTHLFVHNLAPTRATARARMRSHRLSACGRLASACGAGAAAVARALSQSKRTRVARVSQSLNLLFIYLLYGILNSAHKKRPPAASVRPVSSCGWVITLTYTDEK